ncbi:annexin A9 [Discoglossus pictus]
MGSHRDESGGLRETGVWGTLGTIRPHKAFEPEVDVEKLAEALQDKGKRQIIIDIVTGLNNEQRQEVVRFYKEACQQDLIENIKKSLSGDLEKVIVGVLKTPAAYDAQELKAAMKGLGTDESTLTEILSTRTSQQLQEIQNTYRQEFKTDLEKNITSDTSQPFTDLLLGLAKGKREKDSGIIDYGQINQDAKILSTLGPKNSPNVAQWISIFTERSPGHLRRVFEQYNNTNIVNVEESIKKLFKGDFQKALLTIVSIMRNTALYFADRLHSAIKGTGTDDSALRRILISRSETDLLSIRVEFRKKYGKSLYSSIQGDTKGDYQAALLSLCRAEDL